MAPNIPENPSQPPEDRPNDRPDDNVILFQPRPKRNDTPVRRPPPMLNIPPVTKGLVVSLLGVHAIIAALSATLWPFAADYAAMLGGFTPAQWTGGQSFFWWTPLTLVSFSFLHGGWLHVVINSLMLVAMGSGLEKSVGPRRYLWIYAGATLFAILAHLAFYPSSAEPVVGASGGLSGVFGAMLFVMYGRRGHSYSPALVRVALIWIGISVLLGLMGGPSGETVAWVAHVGGFLGGIGLMKMMSESR